MLFIYILIFIASCFLLVKAGSWTVKSLIRISRALEWSGFLSSFVIMALATSLPEFFIGITSSFHGYPQLSFGNIIGANILNLTIGIGIVSLISKGLKVKKSGANQALYASFFVVLPLILILDYSLSRVDGFILLLALGFYLKKLFNEKRSLKGFAPEKEAKDWNKFKLFLKDIALFFSSVIILLLSAEIAVKTANVLAIETGISLVVTGILLVAAGTALPEIIFGAKAVTSGRKDLAWGDFLGSVTINSTLILGVVALISPLKIVNLSPYLSGIIFTFIIAILFALFAKTGKEINKKEAFILIIAYICFAFFQLLAI